MANSLQAEDIASTKALSGIVWNDGETQGSQYGYSAVRKKETDR